VTTACRAGDLEQCATARRSRSLKARHAAVAALLTLAGVGCGSSSAPTPSSTTTTAPPTTTSVPGLTGTFTVQNPPCNAPATGAVSCTFVASATGGSGAYSYQWTFAGPLAKVDGTGQSVRPELPCGLSGVPTFNLLVTLVITSGASTVTVGPTGQQIVRSAGNCGA
jgi:hypothetical protein